MYVCLPLLSPSPMSECDPRGILMPTHNPPSHVPPDFHPSKKNLSGLWAEILFNASSLLIQLCGVGIAKSSTCCVKSDSELRNSCQITRFSAPTENLPFSYCFWQFINIAAFWPDTKATNEKHWQDRSLPLRFWSVRSERALYYTPPLLISTLASNRLSTDIHTPGWEGNLRVCIFILYDPSFISLVRLKFFLWVFSVTWGWALQQVEANDECKSKTKLFIPKIAESLTFRPVEIGNMEEIR